MKKWISLVLAVILVIGTMPTTAFASENTDSMQDLVQAIKNNSTAEIRDADGNVVETLTVDVQIQQLASGRSTEGNKYAITCTARSSEDDITGSKSSGGVLASATLVFTDVFGTENILHSVYGYWSGAETDTKYRNVTYAAYNTKDEEIDSALYFNVGQSFGYDPTAFKGYTFRVFTYAYIVSNGTTLELKVSTDPSDAEN